MPTLEGKIDGATLRIGVVVSRFNSAVTALEMANVCKKIRTEA